jgi:photosystem II stability/assembly factor-like uncharacterized protein
VAVLSILTVSWFGSPRAAAEPSSSPPEMLDDAELADVFFIDLDRGWAVGDRGIILATDDGGRRWTVSDSPVNCRLESVTFIDEQRGWAVGGWIHPYTHRTTGVVLRTENGGRRWARIDAPTLPKLNRVYFTSERDGWAVGNASPMYPSGCFRSRDGGRSWQTVPATTWHSWTTLVFTQQQIPVLLGASGLGRIVDRQVKGSAETEAGLRRLRDLVFVAGSGGWLVGDGGLVRQSVDGGDQWRTPQLPAQIDAFDLAAVGHYGDRIWMAGSPGTRILHTPDGGKTWQWQDTNQHSAIQALHFIDEQRGWAVGALGKVLATRDGGQTWIRQRGFDRVAVLAVFGESSRLPVELLAHVAADEGHLVAVEVVGRRDIEVPLQEQSNSPNRLHEAVIAAGGSAGRAAWQFPLRQPGLAFSAEQIVQGWDTALGGQALEKLEDHLVKRIRQWQPDVVITERPTAQHESALAYLISQVTLAAVRKAADPQGLPHQMQATGLPPWQVQKLFARAADADDGTVTIETTRLATRLGQTLADYSSTARGLVYHSWEPSPRAYGFQLLVTSQSREVAGRSFFSGLVVPPGSATRRAPSAPPHSNLAALSRAAQKQRNVQQLITYASDAEGTSAAWLGQIDELVKDLESTAAGDLLYGLADQFRRDGKIEFAADTLQALVQRYPRHPLTESALMWLAGHLTSQEVRWGLLDGRAPQLTPAVGPTTGSLPAQVSAGNATAARSDGLSWQAYVPLIEQLSPALAADPLLRSVTAANSRHQGQRRDALHLYELLAGSPALGIWSRCARGELWHMNRTGLPPKASANCLQAVGKPRLDGSLNEPFWQSAEAIPLASQWHDDDQWPAEVRLVYDKQYLYLGIVCQRPEPNAVDPPSRGRSRDADLTESDRIEVFLDIDRDYASHYRLAVDHRGSTAESCYGEAGWDPNWFVAQASDQNQWTIEAAVELLSVVAQPPSRGETWLMGLQRTVPEVGFQSWTQPAAVEVRPEGFGYLLFR